MSLYSLRTYGPHGTLGEINEFPPGLYPIPTGAPTQSSNTPTPAPSGQPTQDPCVALASAWAAQNPDLARCLNIYEQSQMLTLCHAVQSGRMTPAQGTQEIQKLVGAACARQAAPTPAPSSSPTPPSGSTPPSTSIPSTSMPGSGMPSSSVPSTPSDQGSGAGPASDQGTAKKSALYRWGPVAGILILLGAGAYYLRQK